MSARRRDDRGCRIRIIDIIRMAGPVAVGDLAVILRALISVLDHERDGRSRRALHPVGLGEDTGQDLHLIGFLPLRGEAARAGLAPVKIALDVFSGDRQARRTAIDDAAKRDAMALSERGDAEQMPESVVRHGVAFAAARETVNWGTGRGGESRQVSPQNSLVCAAASIVLATEA